MSSLAQSNEEIACNHIKALTDAFRKNDATSVRVHTKLLQDLVKTSNDNTIRFAANEALLIQRAFADKNKT